jgi:hypothetical protein
VSPVLKHMRFGQRHIKREFIGAARLTSEPRSKSTACLRIYPRTPASITWRTHRSSECMLNIRTAISGRARQNLSRCQQTIHSRHCVVHKDNSWPQIASHWDSLSAIACSPHDCDVSFILKDAPKTVPNQDVVLNQQDCSLLVHSFLSGF